MRHPGAHILRLRTRLFLCIPFVSYNDIKEGKKGEHQMYYLGEKKRAPCSGDVRAGCTVDFEHFAHIWPHTTMGRG